MRKYRLYILIALFPFVVGIVITGFLLSRRQQSSQAVYLVQLAPSPDQTPLQFSWWHESRELGSHSDGFIASDRAKVARDCRGYSSVTRAQRMLEGKLKDAVQIIERTPVLDEKSNRVGERVVALFASKDANNQEAAIIWTSGEMLCSISAPSLRHVLEFEKWVKGK